ncbi:MAG: hypothetical protein EBU90_11875 [Proteobacteria bacterium]|nr:hypothetical protein [Pseudomonadota bacterium]NBP15360.1 hypothetical protein [bacterium]
MDIKSLNEQIGRQRFPNKPAVKSDGYGFNDIEMPSDQSFLYDLFKATIKNFVDTIKLQTYIVKPEEEMRIDLILKNMYELSDFQISTYYKEIDVILIINNIDNPLNIKSGQVLLYPSLADFDDFRIQTEADISTDSKQTIAQLGVPDKTTRTDSARQKYLKDGVALPPTVNTVAKEGAQIKNGDYIIGGV